MMSEMDGFEMLQLLRKDVDVGGLPVIIMTANDLNAADLQWLQDRSQLCLQKSPLQPQEFVSYIHQLLHPGDHHAV